MCKDPALTYLNDLGYNVVRHPRADLHPLELMGRHRGVLTRLGTLSQLRKAGSPELPSVQCNQPAANIMAKRSRQLAPAVALAVLQRYLTALGATPSAEVNFRQCGSLELGFSEVAVDCTTPIGLATFLEGAALDLTFPLLAPYLENGGELFVITETLKSCRLLVALEGHRTAVFGLDFGVLQAALGVQVGVTATDEAATLLSFDGSEPLVFGFKCLQLERVGRQLLLVEREADPGLAFAATAEAGGSGSSEAPSGPPDALLGTGLLPLGRLARTAAPRAATARAEARRLRRGRGVDDAVDSAPLPEADGLAQGAAAAETLYLQLRTRSGGVPPEELCRLRGPLLGRPPHRLPLAIDTLLRSDTNGVLLLDGCPAGQYLLELAGQRWPVHTLSAVDLERDGTPYQLLVAPSG